MLLARSRIETTPTTASARGERVVLRLERTSDGVVLSVEGGAPSGIEVGTAAAFLAKLHGVDLGGGASR